jgi:hypothetical protein
MIDMTKTFHAMQAHGASDARMVDQGWIAGKASLMRHCGEKPPACRDITRQPSAGLPQ